MLNLRTHVLRVWLVLACSGVLSAKNQPDIEGRIVGITDGDTVTLLTADKTQIKIRLEGIDAPEKKQPFGQKAKEELSTLIFGKDVVIHWKSKDRYQRVIGRINCAGLDVNLEMVKRGMAWRYDKYSKEKAFIDAQAEAKAAGRGLWTDKEPIAPWEWRAEKKAK